MFLEQETRLRTLRGRIVVRPPRLPDRLLGAIRESGPLEDVSLTCVSGPMEHEHEVGIQRTIPHITLEWMQIGTEVPFAVPSPESLFRSTWIALCSEFCAVNRDHRVPGRLRPGELSRKYWSDEDKPPSAQTAGRQPHRGRRSGRVDRT